MGGTAEDRQLFKDAMREIGLDVPQSGLARNQGEALDRLDVKTLAALLDEIGRCDVTVREADAQGASSMIQAIARHLDECPPCAGGFTFELEIRRIVVSKLSGRRMKFIAAASTSAHG